MPFEPNDLFRCTNCGRCCKGYGGTYVSEADIERIADFIQVGKTEFISSYCQLSCGKWMIRQGKNEYCVFWDEGCGIHTVKPGMCRAWPFIEGVLRDVGNWQLMAGECPGIRTDIPDAEIKDCVKRTITVP